MIGDPSGTIDGAEPARPTRLSAANLASIRGQLERFLDFTPGSQGAVMANNLDWLGELVADRFPARRRQALHDPVHARQGLGPDPARARPVVHRVQLHAAPGRRLPAPVPDDGRRAPDGRRRPVGQHHGGSRADPPDQCAEGSSEDQEPAHGLAYKLLLSPSGTEVRQERDGRLGLARSRPDVALCLLPVLAQHRRSRRRDLPALVHRVPAGRNRGAREPRPRARPRARPAQRALALDITARTHGDEAAARAVADSEAKFSGERHRRPGGPALAPSSRPAGSRSTAAGLAAGTAVVLADAGLVASKGEARRLIAGGGVTVNGTRVTDAGLRSGADRRGVARRPHRQTAPRRPPAGGCGLDGNRRDGPTSLRSRARPTARATREPGTPARSSRSSARSGVRRTRRC